MTSDTTNKPQFKPLGILGKGEFKGLLRRANEHRLYGIIHLFGDDPVSLVFIDGSVVIRANDEVSNRVFDRMAMATTLRELVEGEGFIGKYRCEPVYGIEGLVDEPRFNPMALLAQAAEEKKKAKAPRAPARATFDPRQDADGDSSSAVSGKDSKDSNDGSDADDSLPLRAVAARPVEDRAEAAAVTAAAVASISVPTRRSTDGRPQRRSTDDDAAGPREPGPKPADTGVKSVDAKPTSVRTRSKPVDVAAAVADAAEEAPTEAPTKRSALRRLIRTLSS